MRAGMGEMNMQEVLPQITGARLEKVEAFVFRAPCPTPVQTSFGTMLDRPAVFVKITDADGAFGWGEIWCNFPGCGAEHRARLLDTVFRPMLEGRLDCDPVSTWSELQRRTAVLAIQSGERGPIAQLLAGVDLALWDLAARRAQLPLFRLLGGEEANPAVPVYASGINPSGCVEMALKARAAGHTAFKLKIGFDPERDRHNLVDMREALGPAAMLMADANQAWSLAQAREACARLEDLGLAWLEEPMRADVPLQEWKELSEASAIPLAAGENMASEAEFAAAVASGAFRVLQPDAAKWGGITACLPVARAVISSDLRYCPHYLGGGIGLAASAHLLAAAGGDGRLEIDANDNPLRSLPVEAAFRVEQGCIRLPDQPGIGIVPDLVRLSEYAIDWQ